MGCVSSKSRVSLNRAERGTKWSCARLLTYNLTEFVAECLLASILFADDQFVARLEIAFDDFRMRAVVQTKSRRDRRCFPLAQNPK